MAFPARRTAVAPPRRSSKLLRFKNFLRFWTSFFVYYSNPSLDFSKEFWIGVDLNLDLDEIFFFKKTERKRRRTTAVTSLALRTHDCSGSWLGVVASASIAVASASIACVFRFCPLLLPLYRFDFPFFFSHRDRCLSSSLPVRNSHLVLRWNRFHDEDSYTNLWELMMNFG